MLQPGDSNLTSTDQSGARSRFGEGDGSFWDRWIVQTATGLEKGQDEYVGCKWSGVCA
jgi:hypothetical protein